MASPAVKRNLANKVPAITEETENVVQQLKDLFFTVSQNEQPAEVLFDGINQIIAKLVQTKEKEVVKWKKKVEQLESDMAVKNGTGSVQQSSAVGSTIALPALALQPARPRGREGSLAGPGGMVPAPPPPGGAGGSLTARASGAGGRLAVPPSGGPAPPVPRYTPSFQRSMVVCSKKPTPSPRMAEAPTGRVALVFTDVQGSTKLWDGQQVAMKKALALHNSVLRKLIEKKEGYEVKTGGDSFMVAFSSARLAVRWCLAVQVALMKVEWPPELLQLNDSKMETVGDHVVWNGLRVRMGVHVGSPICDVDPITKRMDYFGTMVNASARIQHIAQGGQIVISEDVYEEVKDESGVVFSFLGTKKLRGLSDPIECYSALPLPLKRRTFPPDANTATSVLQWAEEEQLRQTQAIEVIDELRLMLTAAGAGKGVDDDGEDGPGDGEDLNDYDEDGDNRPASSLGSRPTGNGNGGRMGAAVSEMVRAAKSYSGPDMITAIASEIQDSRNLWRLHPEEMKQALVTHNKLVRRLIRMHQGTETYNELDAFCVTFKSPIAAYMFCMDLQQQLDAIKWSTRKNSMETGATAGGPSSTVAANATVQSPNVGQWKGIKVKMAMKLAPSGSSSNTTQALTPPMTSTGGSSSPSAASSPTGNPLVDMALALLGSAHGGAVLLQRDAYTSLRAIQATAQYGVLKACTLPTSAAQPSSGGLLGASLKPGMMGTSLRGGGAMSLASSTTSLASSTSQQGGDNKVWYAVPKSMGIRLNALPEVPEPAQRFAAWLQECREQHASKMEVVNRVMDAVSTVSADIPPEMRAMPAPQGEVTLVYTELADTMQLWQDCTTDMATTMRLYHAEVRRLARLHEAYEVKKTEAGGFLLAFASASQAVKLCLSLQVSLLSVPWPKSILQYVKDHAGPQQNYSAKSAEDPTVPLWCGPSARVAVHMGRPYSAQDPITGRQDYFGTSQEQALMMFGMCVGGETLISRETYDKVNDEWTGADAPLVSFSNQLTIGTTSVNVLRLLPFVLRGRTFESTNAGARAKSIRTMTIGQWWAEEEESQQAASPVPGGKMGGDADSVAGQSDEPINLTELIERCIEESTTVYSSLATGYERLGVISSLIPQPPSEDDPGANTTTLSLSVQDATALMDELNDLMLTFTEVLQGQQTALDILHMVLSSGGSSMSAIVMKPRPEQDDFEYNWMVAPKTPVPPPPKGSYSATAAGAETSGVSNLPGKRMSIGGVNKMSVLPSDQILMLHRCARFYFNLVKQYVEHASGEIKEESHGQGKAKKITPEGFVSDWTKFTTSLGYIAIAEKGAKKMAREEFSDQLALTITSEAEEERLSKDPPRLVASIIGHLGQHFRVVRRALQRRENAVGGGGGVGIGMTRTESSDELPLHTTNSSSSIRSEATAATALALRRRASKKDLVVPTSSSTSNLTAKDASRSPALGGSVFGAGNGGSGVSPSPSDPELKLVSRPAGGAGRTGSFGHRPSLGGAPRTLSPLLASGAGPSPVLGGNGRSMSPALPLQPVTPVGESPSFSPSPAALASTTTATGALRGRSGSGLLSALSPGAGPGPTLINSSSPSPAPPSGAGPTNTVGASPNLQLVGGRRLSVRDSSKLRNL